MLYHRILLKAIAVGCSIAAIVFTFSPEVRAVGFPDDLSSSAHSRVPVPDSHGSTKNIHSYIKGFNFSGIPDTYLFTPSFSESIEKRELITPLYAVSLSGPAGQKDVLEQIKSDTGSILAMAVGTIAFLYVMPESFSKWPQEKKDLSPDKLWERYDGNVFSGGPVWDNDEWEVNYIGHPYFGAAYYSHAMNRDFTRLESLSYSFMMSTCLYEYGLEAFFEDPSIQDLFVTPLAGALFGEVFISMKNSIHTNGDKVLGSKALGAVCMFMLDPISATLEPINRFNEKYSKLHMEGRYYSRSTVTSDKFSNAGSMYDHRVGVEISVYTYAFSK